MSHKIELHSFVKNNFNEDTADWRIRLQENVIQTSKGVIKSAEEKIEKIKKTAYKQLSLPWYEWEDTTFKVVGYDSIDHFRDHVDYKRSYPNYLEMVKEIIMLRHPHLFYRKDRCDSYDFIVRSPSDALLVLNLEETYELPLVKEFSEREQLIKMKNQQQRKINRYFSKMNEIKRLDEPTNDASFYQERINELLTPDQKKRKKEMLDQMKELNRILEPLDRVLPYPRKKRSL